MMICEHAKRGDIKRRRRSKKMDARATAGRTRRSLARTAPLKSK